METLKCYVCKRTQPKSEFQTFKSCQSCRKKKSSKKDTVPISQLQIVEIVNKIEPVKIEPVKIEPVKIEPVKIEWCLLSNKWIRKGEEQRLHRLLLKKVNRQFLFRCSFPVHKYLTKELMVDIRDI